MRYREVKASELIIPITIEKLHNGDYLATSHDLPDLVAQGRTMAEAAELAQDVARKLLESYHEHGDPLPAALQKQLRKKSKASQLQIPIAVNF